MPFAIAVNNLVEAMKQPGCPICRIGHQGARRALESFLWENVNEPDVRQGILDAYGFCPPHTRVMVAQELFSSSIPLGTNIIYEHLGRVVAGELKTLRPGSASGAVRGAAGALQGFLQRLGLSRSKGPLHPRGECPACTAGNNAAFNSLHVLCEELNAARPASAPEPGNRVVADVPSVYLAGDGLCLPHLRDAIERHSTRFPRGVTLLIDTTVARLESQSKHMKEYIRKNNWAYRDEKLTEEEDTAWRKDLTFFTGYSGERFTYKVED